MLDICLGILSVLGILLLALAAFAVASLLLVLFFPLTYRIGGFGNQGAFGVTVKVRWLFGLVRAVCAYPDPGRLKVRALCFTLYDQDLTSKEGQEAGAEEKGKKDREKAKGRRKRTARKKGRAAVEKEAGESGCGGAERGEAAKDSEGSEPSRAESSSGQKEDGTAVRPWEKADGSASGQGDAGEASGGESTEQGFFSGLRARWQKIKYTFQAICDKIKKIWENISYYIDLVKEEDTKLLLSESLAALGKVLKSIRPRRVRADIRFGTGAPDTTGYAYGVYCMLSAAWGPGFLVTPDFEKKVLEGEFDLSGRITVWVLLANGLKMYKLIRKLKAARKLSA